MSSDLDYDDLLTLPLGKLKEYVRDFMNYNNLIECSIGIEPEGTLGKETMKWGNINVAKI